MEGKINYPYCYLCNEIISSDKEHSEHIILNALGGRLKSKDILCLDCEKKYIDAHDRKLANQLQQFSTLFSVQRDRGENQPIKNLKGEDGKEYLLDKDLKPKIQKYQQPSSIVDSEGNIKITLTGRNYDDIKNQLKQLKSKYPELDVGVWMNKVKDQGISSHPSPVLKTGFSLNHTDPNILKAVVKVICEYIVHSTKDYDLVKELVPYLKGEKENIQERCWFYIPPTAEQVTNQDICHIIQYEQKADGTVYGWVQFFSAFSFIILVTKNSNCAIEKNCYTYDLIQSSVKEDINFSIPLKEELTEEESLNRFKARLSWLVKKADTYQFYKNSLETLFDSIFTKKPLSDSLKLQYKTFDQFRSAMIRLAIADFWNQKVE